MEQGRQPSASEGLERARDRGAQEQAGVLPAVVLWSVA